MRTAAPKGDGATKHRITAEHCFSTTSAVAGQPPVADLPTLRILRTRLAGARRRLIERIASDWTDDRRFPDSGWTRMLADIQVCILAVDGMLKEQQHGN